MRRNMLVLLTALVSIVSLAGCMPSPPTTPTPSSSASAALEASLRVHGFTPIKSWEEPGKPTIQAFARCSDSSCWEQRHEEGLIVYAVGQEVILLEELHTPAIAIQGNSYFHLVVPPPYRDFSAIDAGSQSRLLTVMDQLRAVYDHESGEQTVVLDIGSTRAWVSTDLRLSQLYEAANS